MTALDRGEDETLRFEDGRTAMAEAIGAMRGHANWASLKSIFDQAVTDHGFTGSMSEAASILQQMAEVQVELAPELGRSRVYSQRWS